MYPVVFRVGEFEVTSFGVLVATGALVGLWLFRRELRISGLPREATDLAVVGVLAGLVGAKLLWVAEHQGEGPVLSLVLSRAGLSWFGGFVGGVGTAVWMMRRRRWPVVAILAAATPALAVGHAIGRVGCFLVGDDYGVPSTLPWAVAFPAGAPPTIVPVHPTQLYEAVALLPIAALLIRWRRRGAAPGLVLGGYLVLTGVLRFLVEFVRVNERVALGLTVAQWAAVTVGIVGVTLIGRTMAHGRATKSLASNRAAGPRVEQTPGGNGRGRRRAG